MMRPRRASTIAALCVLVSATTAHAECAWETWMGERDRAVVRNAFHPQRHRRPARAEGEVTVTRSQREASECRGGCTNAQPDFWRSVVMSRRRRSPWRRSGVAR
jgi:hypothetical protein